MNNMLTYDICTLFQDMPFKLFGHYFDRLYKLKNWIHNRTIKVFIIKIYGEEWVNNPIAHHRSNLLLYAAIYDYKEIVVRMYNKKYNNDIWLGGIDTIKWLYKNNIPGYSFEALRNALYNGNLNLLKYFHMIYGVDLNYIVEYAQSHHMLFILKWVDSINSSFITATSCKGMLVSDNVEFVKWYRKRFSLNDDPFSEYSD